MKQAIWKNARWIVSERIYITRKMVAVLRNDDELARSPGHELGHVLTHQKTIIVSELFREILGVNGVSDRKDISEKLGRVLDNVEHDTTLLRKAAEIIERQKGFIRMKQIAWRCRRKRRLGFRRAPYVELFERSAGTNRSSGGVLTDSFGRQPRI